MAHTAIDKLQNVGFNLFEPFTKSIVKILTDMQSNIDALQKRIEILEGSPPREQSPTKSDKKASTPSSATLKPSKPGTKKSFRQRIKEKEKEKAEQEAEAVAEPEPEAESKVSDEKDNTETASEVATPESIEAARGAKKELKWNFQRDHNMIQQANNGIAAIKPPQKAGTVKFGKFVSKDDGTIVAYQIKFDTQGMGRTPSGYAFGVITKEYSNFTLSNFGQNGSVMLKGNGQYVTSDDFKSTNPTYTHRQIIPAFKAKGVFETGDTVCLDIDFAEMKLKIWNETRNDGQIFEVSLPDKPICPMVFMGGSQKRKIAVSAQYSFQPKA